MLPSEQLGAGGSDSVRGYDTRVANGSQGFLLSQEFRSPSFSLLGHPLPNRIADQAQLLVFFDYGDVHERPAAAGTPDHFVLAGTGAGLRYSVSRFVDLRLD